eukprot:g5930.t1
MRSSLGVLQKKTGGPGGSFTPLEDTDDTAAEVFGDAGMSVDQDGGGGRLERLRRSRTFTLTLMTLVVVLLFADQNLLAPNLSAVAEEFGFDEVEKDRHLGGDIAIAFFGFGAPASLLIGWLTDVVDRRNLFVTIVLIGELGALATVFATTFSQLFWTRAITGVAIGGGMPLVYSILGDLVGSAGRTEASGMVGISIGIGQGMGQVVAGFTGSCTSLGWRLPFLLVALPCLALTVLMLVATRDPPRGRLEAGLQEHFQAGGEYTERPSLKGLRMLASTPTVLLVLLQGLPGCIPWSVITVYLPDFLHKQRGLSIERATVIGVTFGVATTVGQLAGAQLGQKLYNFRARLQPLLMGATTISGAFPCIMMIRYSGGLFGPYVLYAFSGGCLAAVTGPNIRSVLMNVTPPSTRGSAFGAFNLFDDLGRGLGPALVSLLVVMHGREDAFTIATLAWLACGALLLLMMATFQRDEQKVQSHLLEYGRTVPTLPKNGSVSALSSRLPAPGLGGSTAAAAAAGAAAATRYTAVAAGDVAADFDHGTDSAAAAAAAAAAIGTRFEPEEQKRGGYMSTDGEVEVGGRGIGGAVGSDSEQPRRRVWV